MKKPKIRAVALAIPLLVLSAAASLGVAAPTSAPPPPPKGQVDCIMRGDTSQTVIQEHGPCDLGSDPAKGDRGTSAGGGTTFETCDLAYGAAMRQCHKPANPTATEEKAYQACANNAAKQMKICQSGH